MSLLNDTLQAIKPVDDIHETELRNHLDSLTKPPGSLGRLEDIAVRYCMIRGTTTPEPLKKRIVVFAGDHGVASEGVSAFPQEVTPQMVVNMLNGGAAVNVLARHVGAEVVVVDLGVKHALEDAKGLIRRKIKQGTANITNGPAMTRDETMQAMETGIRLAQSSAEEGVTLLGTGEMGIANTTPSSALFSVLLPCSVEDVTGLGTGIDNARHMHKISVIQRAIDINKESLNGPQEVLAALGGYEIAGICGLILGASSCGIPIVVDGFISSAGALVACRMCEHVRDYLFFSHCSAEKGHRTFFKVFDAKPLFEFDMRLGEGTGAALAMNIIDGAIKIYNEMATFSSAGIKNKS